MMRYPRVILCLLAAAALAGGCASDAKKRRAEEASQTPLPDERDLNTSLVNVAFDQQVAAGAVADRTIYDHHFAANGVTLNTLGERQVDMLVEASTNQPIVVNLPNTATADSVHEGRVATVRQRLIAAGVSEDRLEIGDAPPGGPGILTEIIIQAMQANQPAQGRRAGAAANRAQGAGRAGGTGAGGAGRAGGGAGTGGTGGGAGRTTR